MLVKGQKGFLWMGIAALLALGWMLQPGQASAHATLEQAMPEPGTRLEAGPERIELHFNEAVEANIGAVTVLDAQSRSVTDAAPETSGDRRSVTLPLPELGEGIYTVSYRIISADGHPVAGSYVFVVGDPPEAKDASAFDLHKQLGHTGHGGAETQLTTKAFITYVVRVLYYGSLMLAAGYMLWKALLARRSARQAGAGADSPASAGLLDTWGLWVTRAFLVAVLLYVFIHSTALMEGQPAADWPRLFTRTAVGLSWSGIILLALVGPVIRKAGTAIGVGWAAAALLLESLSGHAAAYEPKTIAVAVDFIHLVASAVWAGGLALLIGFWFADRKQAGRFAAAFTGPAWMSIAVLTLTGVGMSMLFLPKLTYLFYTGWGTLLLVKTGLVLLVIVTGALLRMRVKRGDLPHATLLKADGVLMALIVVIVALFTYISPLPANEPVYAHKMGEDMHVTFRVSPNLPGDNELIVKIWLPESLGAPKSVALRLLSDDRPELGAIDVPIKAYEDDEIDSFTGFVKATYRASGPYIPFAGRWTAQIRVLDSQDTEKVHEEKFRNY